MFINAHGQRLPPEVVAMFGKLLDKPKAYEATLTEMLVDYLKDDFSAFVHNDKIEVQARGSKIRAYVSVDEPNVKVTIHNHSGYKEEPTFSRTIDLHDPESLVRIVAIANYIISQEPEQLY